MRRWLTASLLLFPILGCRSVTVAEPHPSRTWDLTGAQLVRWQADEPSFGQDFAIEASGLAVSQHFLYVPSEKYGRLILVDLSDVARAVSVRLAVPRHAELEGVALIAGGMLLCDEAHAAVYEVPIEKIGFEGIEIDPDNGTVYLLLERSGTDVTGCVSRIWSLQRTAEGLRSDGDPVEVGLEECTWRLSGLAWWDGRMIALKTQFPGEQYEIVTVDLATGSTDVVLDLTEFLRPLGTQGWSNNVEGIALGRDGSLWLVADNAVTGVIDNPLPPPTEERTLLIRLPPMEGN
jgi:hypothetical protein